MIHVSRKQVKITAKSYKLLKTVKVAFIYLDKGMIRMSINICPHLCGPCLFGLCSFQTFWVRHMSMNLNSILCPNPNCVKYMIVNKIEIRTRGAANMCVPVPTSSALCYITTPLK